MTSYSFDSKSLFKDGKRWFPVMGEIHYSRYPEQYWKEAVLKMKEGGVDVISSYVIWIHHEEEENKWDWSGCRNLRKFVEVIKECGMSMLLRIGPWVHAEVRNGGFPDWLLKKCPDARTNSEAYFAEVKKLYEETFEQVKGLMLKDGGPIIGVQIENEFGHCGGLCGEEGEFHMKHLTQMAKDAGFDVPLYTATGWGGAITGGLLPVMGGYCEAPWDPRVTEIEPSVNYVFTYERNDHGIGSDYGLGEGITFDMNKFPYLTAELGGGLQVTYKRRPVARGKDIGGMSLAKMGSGCNLLGYYMYHGGCNPEGKLTTLEENTSTGSINDLPVKNYDFRAPLGEYGKPNATYGEIKLYSLFLHDFGEVMAGTDTYIPVENPVDADNLKDLRTSWRYSECKSCGKKKGFVFVNNYQRRYKMADHRNVVLKNADAGVDFNAVDILDGDMFFLPFNFSVGKNNLASSLATPLCSLNEKAFVFYGAASPAGKIPAAESSVCDITDADKVLYIFDSIEDAGIKIVTLTRTDALNAHKVTAGCGKEFIFITDAALYQENLDGRTLVHFETEMECEVKVYPAFENVPSGLEYVREENGFAVYKTGASGKLSVESSEKTEDGKLVLTVKTDSFDASDAFIEINYTGNCARLYEGGMLKDDSIYIGEDFPWRIYLKRFGKGSHEFRVEIDPLLASQKAVNFIETWPEFNGDSLCRVNAVKTGLETAVTLEL